MQFPKSSLNPSVKIVAIAKDEAPYIAEWVYHHLWFGFNSIHVYVNRSSDSTLDILGKIHEKFPNVTYESADWVDWVGVEEVSRKLQAISYSLAFYNSKSVCDCEYILFIDIDEFWMSKDFDLSIKDCLEELGHPDMISFEWERLLGEEIEFSHIPKELPVDRNGLVKSLVSTSLEMKKMRLHVPIVADGCNHVLSDGSTFVPASYTHPGFSQFVTKELSYAKKYFILHRMYRSEREYISTLMRGNPEQRSDIKLNRKGFLQPHDHCDVVCLPKKNFSPYRQGLLKFYSECDVVDLINKAQENALKKYEFFLEKLPLLYLKKPKDIDVAMDGVTDENVNSVLDKLRPLVQYAEGIVSRKGISQAGSFRDLAFSFEKEGEFFLAYYMMCRAQKLRPKGPLINKSISRYEAQVVSIK